MVTSLQKILEYAEHENIGIGAFNIGNKDIFDSILKAAELTNSPVIVECAPAEIDFLGDDFFSYVRTQIENSRIPICLHLDHGKNMEIVRRAIQLGFQSVMIDASDRNFEENIKITREVCEYAHAYQVDVEGELGTIGTTGRASCGHTAEIKIQYTEPDSAKLFCELTGVNALAIAIGTSHGLYPENEKPELRIDILDAIHKCVKVPLVLHGGSGNKDEELVKAVKHGIRKINVSSEVKEVYFNGIKSYLETHPGEVKTQIIQTEARLCTCKKIKERIQLFRVGGMESGEIYI